MSENPIALANEPESPDDIERALGAYIRLPHKVDLHLIPAGLTLETDDFPKLIYEASGLDLRQYFDEAFRYADFLNPEDVATLVDQLMVVCSRVRRFDCDAAGARLQLTEESTVELPQQISHGLVQLMLVGKSIAFRLDAKSLEHARLVDIAGITFRSGGKDIALAELEMKAENGICHLTARLNEHACLMPEPGQRLNWKKFVASAKEWLLCTVIRRGAIKTDLPVVMADFQNCLRDAIKFKALVQDPAKDLLMFIEKMANVKVEDPFTKALLRGGNHISKQDESLEIAKDFGTLCDFGGVILNISGKLKCLLARNAKELRIKSLSGIGLKIPFDPPDELKALGVDIERTLPKELTELCLSAADRAMIRKLTIGIGAGRWVALDLSVDMQPAKDKHGNWVIYGFVSNPISGLSQPFYVRLDANNNVNMSTQEYADLLAQTALHGFDPSDPSTWKWGAIALSSQSLLSLGQSASSFLDTALDEVESLADIAKKEAKKLGEFIGWLTKDL